MADRTAGYVLKYLSPATLKFYDSTLRKFYVFISMLDPHYDPFPINSGHVSLFASHLFENGFAASTIATRLSAISFAYKLFNKPDPVNTFLITSLVKSFRKMKPQHDARLPITPSILSTMLACVPQLGLSYYRQVMFKSMLALSFAAFLRPGEVTGSINNILRQNVQVVGDTVVIKFVHYKHAPGRPFTLTLNASQSLFCPVALLIDYLRIRGPYVGPLFVLLSGMPVSYHLYKSMFQAALVRVGVSGRMSLHSIRIGAATHAAAIGLSDSVIQKCGRWKSSAYRNYIRLPSFQM